MPCFSPLKGYRSRTPSGSGRFPIVFNPKHGFIDQVVEVACGNCIGCRLERARQAGVRISDHALMHDRNSYLTLTYDDESVPADGSLCHADVQSFMKRLRSRIKPKVSYVVAGEYGDDEWRPHYHMALFNYCPTDLVYWKDSKGFPLYRSPFLEEVWRNGFVFVGDLNFDTGCYIGGYVLKKINGDLADEHYKRFDPETGEIYWLKPEYIVWSNGIGRSCFERFGSDVFPADRCVVKGKPQKPPKYYDRLYEADNPEDMKRIKEERSARALKHKQDSTPRRLRDREEVSKARAKLFGHK